MALCSAHTGTASEGARAAGLRSQHGLPRVPLRPAPRQPARIAWQIPPNGPKPGPSHSRTWPVLASLSGSRTNTPSGRLQTTPMPCKRDSCSIGPSLTRLICWTRKQSSEPISLKGNAAHCHASSREGPATTGGRTQPTQVSPEHSAQVTKEAAPLGPPDTYCIGPSVKNRRHGRST